MPSRALSLGPRRSPSISRTFFPSRARDRARFTDTELFPSEGTELVTMRILSSSFSCRSSFSRSRRYASQKALSVCIWEISRPVWAPLFRRLGVVRGMEARQDRFTRRLTSPVEDTVRRREAAMRRTTRESARPRAAPLTALLSQGSALYGASGRVGSWFTTSCVSPRTRRFTWGYTSMTAQRMS